jgi:hypothetical protein
MLHRPNGGLWVAGAAWLAVLIAGFAALSRYKAAPGAGAAAPARWPAASTLEPARDRPTLLLFAHPRCPCTRASLSELARLASRVEARPRIYVVFDLPRGLAAEWAEGDLWTSAARIPGARAVADLDGAESARFAARTSGTTLLYASDGRLLFTGGLTAARAHEGDSFGQQRLIALLEGRTPDRADSPVFGCALPADPPKEASP